MSQAIIQLDPKVPKEIKKLASKMKNLAKQIPFVTSLTLNNTAFDVRHHIVNKVFPNSFTVRNKRFAGAAFRVKKSSKRNLEAHVFDKLETDYLMRQITGGTKKSRGSGLLVPVQAKRTGRGTKNPRTYAKAFPLKLKSGGEGIFQRYGRKQGNVRLLFWKVPTVHIPRKFPFFKEGTRKANEVIQKHYTAAWHRAVRTAKL